MPNISANMLAKLDTVFTQTFGVAPTRHFQAPGRVNLIGEHTDITMALFCLVPLIIKP